MPTWLLYTHGLLKCNKKILSKSVNASTFSTNKCFHWKLVLLFRSYKGNKFRVTTLSLSHKMILQILPFFVLFRQYYFSIKWTNLKNFLRIVSFRLHFKTEIWVYIIVALVIVRLLANFKQFYVLYTGNPFHQFIHIFGWSFGQRTLPN